MPTTIVYRETLIKQHQGLDLGSRQNYEGDQGKTQATSQVPMDPGTRALARIYRPTKRGNIFWTNSSSAGVNSHNKPNITIPLQNITTSPQEVEKLLRSQDTHKVLGLVTCPHQPTSGSSCRTCSLPCRPLQPILCNWRDPAGLERCNDHTCTQSRGSFPSHQLPSHFTS